MVPASPGCALIGLNAMNTSYNMEILMTYKEMSFIVSMVKYLTDCPNTLWNLQSPSRDILKTSLDQVLF